MFISKTKKSPFYQLTYKVNCKRTTVSTKSKNLIDAQTFLMNFQPDNNKQEKQCQVQGITLS